MLPRVISTVSLGALPIAQALDITTATLLQLRDALRQSRLSNDHRTADLAAALVDDLTNIRTHIRDVKPTRKATGMIRPPKGAPHP